MAASYFVRNAFRPEILPLTVSTAAGVGLVTYQGNHLFTKHNDIVLNKKNPRQIFTDDCNAGSGHVDRESRVATYNKMLNKEKWF